MDNAYDDEPDADDASDLAYAAHELRQALADQWAEPLPCSGMQALNRDRRVYFARLSFAKHFGRVAA